MRCIIIKLFYEDVFDVYAHFEPVNPGTKVLKWQFFTSEIRFPVRSATVAWGLQGLYLFFNLLKFTQLDMESEMSSRLSKRRYLFSEFLNFLSSKQRRSHCYNAKCLHYINTLLK